MNDYSIPTDPDTVAAVHGWLPLDTARDAFTVLVTGPQPLAVNGRAFAGLPARVLPLDEVRDRLLDRHCPTATRDAVWRHLVHRARRDGATWMVACVGVALPGLAASARWLAARYRGDRADVHAAVLTGFIEALASLDVRDPGVLSRLLWCARRAGQAALAESLDAPIPSVSMFASHTPRTPYGHPDLVLARAVGDGVLTPAEADLISATRLGDESVTGWAQTHDKSVHAVAKARERAERRLVSYLADPDYPHEDGPDSEDPVAATALRRLRPARAESAVASASSDGAESSPTVSGRGRNGRTGVRGSKKKSSLSVSKKTSKSGLVQHGNSTPSTPLSPASTPSSEVRRCA